MHPVRKRRLILVIFVLVVASAGIGLVLYALQENISFFYTPSAVVSGEAPQGPLIRVGGMVVANSVVRDTKALEVRFKVSDGASDVTIVYAGILPDMFAESEAAVAVGRLRADGVLEADEVLAKHDEKYTPPEVADAMSKAYEAQQKQKATLVKPERLAKPEKLVKPEASAQP